STSILGLAALLCFAAGFWFSEERWWNGRGRAFLALWSGALSLAAFGLWRQGAFRPWMEAFYLDKALPVASFLGGSFLFVLSAPWLIGRASRRAQAACAGFGLTLFVVARSGFGGFSDTQALLFAGFAASSGAFLAMAARRPRRNSSSNRFLMIWL